MLYIVELDLAVPERIAEWEAWYRGHAELLLSLPGFLGAQHFRSATAPMSFMNVYSIAGTDAIEGPAYRAKAGPGSTGEWRALMVNWHRNLLDGIDRAPEVAAGGWLGVVDRLDESAAALPAGWVSLRPVGLDRTIVERGLRFGAPGVQPELPQATPGIVVRLFRPALPLQRPRSPDERG